MFDFEKNGDLETLDNVPEDFRSLYSEREGRFVLNTEDETVGPALKALTGASKALRQARSDAEKARGQRIDLSPLADYGTTVDEILTSFTTRYDELQEQLKDKDGNQINVEKLKATLAEKHGNEIKTKNDQIEKLTGQIQSLVIDTDARRAILDNDPAVDIDIVLPFVSGQVKVIDSDGKPAARVVDEDGEIRMSPVTGEPMTIDELVKGMKKSEKFGVFFKSDAPKGAGSNPGGSRRRVPVGVGAQGDDVPYVTKIARGLKRRGM